MKKLNIYPNSRMPLWWRDLEYMSDGFSEVFEAVLKGLSLDKTDFVISGCEITKTATKVSMSAGWCYYDGEILPVMSMLPTSYRGIPKIKFTKTTNHNDAGDRIITLSGTTSTAHVHSDDYLTPSLVSGDEDYHLAIGPGAWNLGERIVNATKMVDSGMIEATVINAGLGSVRYRQVGGVVQLFGELFNDAQSGFNGAVVQGLPQPAAGLVFPLNSGAGDSSGSIQIATDGTMSISTQSNRVHLGHVVYLATPVSDIDDKHYSTIQSEQQGGAES